MAKAKKASLLPDEAIISKIYFIRGQKVMLDRDQMEKQMIQNSEIVVMESGQ